MAKQAVAAALEKALSYEPSKTVHIVTQKKGGVGKSTIAKWVAEYLQTEHRKMLGFDIDPSQQTFARTVGLNVQTIDVLKNDEIDPRLFAPMILAIIENEGPFVIDSGASNFHPFWKYIVGSRLFSIFERSDRQVVLHVPLAPKPDLEDTLAGLDQICPHCPDRSVVVWMNQREYPIDLDGKTFVDMEVAQRHKGKIRGVVVNSLQRNPWTRDVVERMLINRWTFANALREMDTLSKFYVVDVRDEVFDQLREMAL